MNLTNYPQVIQTAISVLKGFEEKCQRFILKEYVLSELPKLSYELREYYMVNDEEFRRKRKSAFYDSLLAIQARLEYIAINGVWTLDNHMEATWRSLGKVYDELNILLGFQIEFDHEEKVKEIEH